MNSYVIDSERKPALKSVQGSDEKRTKVTKEDSLTPSDLDFMTAVSRIKNIMDDTK